MAESSADTMRKTMNLINENLDHSSELARIKSSMADISTSVANYLKFHNNKGKVLHSALERVTAIKQRNPDKSDRVAQLEQRFISRLQQATTQDDINKAYKALLDTLDKEKIL